MVHGCSSSWWDMPTPGTRSPRPMSSAGATTSSRRPARRSAGIPARSSGRCSTASTSRGGTIREPRSTPSRTTSGGTRRRGCRSSSCSHRRSIGCTWSSGSLRTSCRDSAACLGQTVKPNTTPNRGRARSAHESAVRQSPAWSSPAYQCVPSWLLAARLHRRFRGRGDRVLVSIGPVEQHHRYIVSTTASGTPSWR